MKSSLIPQLENESQELLRFPFTVSLLTHRAIPALYSMNTKYRPRAPIRSSEEELSLVDSAHSRMTEQGTRQHTTHRARTGIGRKLPRSPAFCRVFVINQNTSAGLKKNKLGGEEALSYNCVRFQEPRLYFVFCSPRLRLLCSGSGTRRLLASNCS